MIRKTLVLLAVGLLFGADTKEKDKTDDDRIKGTWLLSSEEEAGNTKHAEGKMIKVTFATEGKGKVEYPTDRPNLDFTFQLDATRKPKQLTFMADAQTFQGIYKLDGDTLTVCLAKQDNGERPTEFATKEGDQLTLVVLKREKK